MQIQKRCAIEEIPADWEALDIGPKTAELYRDVIQKSKLVIWNGPMGVFEIDKFADGTKAVAESLAEAGYIFNHRWWRFCCCRRKVWFG